MRSKLLRGMLAGAAGTTALNAFTYLDMALRGRPASQSPEQTIERVEELAGSELPDRDAGTDGNRRSGWGALLGIGAGVGTGAVYGLVAPRSAPLPLLAVGAGLGANIASTAPMTAFGITDPRTWTWESWMMDLVPHLAYGLATAATFAQLSPHRARRHSAGFRVQWG